MYIENFVREFLESKGRLEGKVSVPSGFVREIIPKCLSEMELQEPGSLYISISED